MKNLLPALDATATQIAMTPSGVEAWPFAEVPSAGCDRRRPDRPRQRFPTGVGFFMAAPAIRVMIGSGSIRVQPAFGVR
jgi:hypothetical protein